MQLGRGGDDGFGVRARDGIGVGVDDEVLCGGGGGRNPFGRSPIEIEQQPFRHGAIGTPLSLSLSL